MNGTFYNSKLWQRERVRILSERGRTCEECGSVRPPMHVHHVFGLGGDECEVLCSRCYAERHGGTDIDSPGRARCGICGQTIVWVKTSGGKWFPREEKSRKRHECKTGHRFTPLKGLPVMVWPEGETPLGCAHCGVELVDSKRPLCLWCHEAWIRGDII